MKVFSIHEFADFLVSAAMVKQLEHGEHEALEWIGRVVEAEAKSAIGTYKYNWAPLQPETIKRKTTGDSPLLETGELRDSIQHVVTGHEVHIGSNDDKAVWHELGTKTIPPRPFLTNAAKAKVPEIKLISKIAIGAAIASRNIEVEILRLAGHALHELKHTAEELVEENNDKQRNHH